MKGLELSRRFYDEYGKEMIETQFAEYAGRIAVGLAGEGSECFGFDDDISTDHDFEPGFCLWITDEDDEKFGFKLERAYSKLPREFFGYKRQILSPMSDNRHGVIRIGKFYQRFLGAQNAPDSVHRWLYTPSHALACASNGEIFRDDAGIFSEVRSILNGGYPKDVRMKKIAAHTTLMSQSGLYNYERCINHGERGAAQLAVFEFVKHAVSVIFLLNNEYEPFYKWVFRKMRDLPLLSETEKFLVRLTETGNSDDEFSKKLHIIEDVSNSLITEYKNLGIADEHCSTLEQCAFSATNRIKDPILRNMHIMDGI